MSEGEGPEERGERAERRATQDDWIVAALVAGQSYPGAAAAAGVSEQTVYRRMKEDDFRQRVRDGRTERTEAVTGGLLALAPEFLMAISDCVERGNDPRDRLRAAGLGLTNLVKLQQIQELVAEVAEIKRELAAIRSEREST